ncbi:SDR family oxidoreductase [Streptomyces lydicus]|nr:SDR family oxidoreductase [Streptomyces lydicus]
MAAVRDSPRHRRHRCARFPCRWLACRPGAQRLVLTSRRGPAAPGVDALVADLAARGAQATVVACDVADRNALAAVLEAIPAAHPLTAVVHAAGIVDDGIVDAMTPQRLSSVLSAKAMGAAHLDALTEGMDLDAFVLFSSLAGMLGNPGQANYAAANAYLDSLAEQRRARGLAATSVAWGPWAEAGMADEQVAAAGGHRTGVGALDPELALTALGQAVDHRDCVVAVADIDWAALAPGLTAVRPIPLLEHLVGAPGAEAGAVTPETGTDTGPARATALRAELAAAAGPEGEQIVLDLVLEETALVLRHGSAGEIDAERPFRFLGFTSLAAVELRNALSAATGLTLPVSLIFDHPTPAAVAEFLRAGLAPETAPPGTGSILAELDRLESTLAAQLPEGDEAEALATRLENILSRLQVPHQENSKVAENADSKLEEASVDDLLEIIQSEFGKS